MSNDEIKANTPVMMIGILWIIIVGIMYVGGSLYVDSFVFGMIMLPGFLMISTSTKKSQQKRSERKNR